jgi:hypothetical protein
MFAADMALMERAAVTGEPRVTPGRMAANRGVAMKFLNNLLLWRKLAIFGILGGALVAGPLVMYVTLSNHDIAAAAPAGSLVTCGAAYNRVAGDGRLVRAYAS